MDEETHEYIGVFMSTINKVFENASMENQANLQARYGIFPIHVRYLMAMHKGPITLTGLSQALYMDKANTTRAVAFLRSKGYVQDDRVRENQRGYKVSLTPEGTALANEINRNFDIFLSKAMSGVSTDEFIAFVNMMEKVCLNIGDKAYGPEYIEDVKSRIKLPPRTDFGEFVKPTD